MNHRFTLLGLLALAVTTSAQTPPANKKLYCWEENGTRVCGDALPAEAVNKARVEFNAKSGMRTGEVQRAMTEEERSVAAEDAERQRADAAAAETRKRTERAMLTSYATEADLRRVFDERVALLDNSVDTAKYNIAGLREGLVTLLQGAAEKELAGHKIKPETTADIRKRHAELLRLQRLQADFERRRKELDGEIAETMQRYREIKGIAGPTVVSTLAVTPAKQ
jgi:hypothetical protein